MKILRPLKYILIYQILKKEGIMRSIIHVIKRDCKMEIVKEVFRSYDIRGVYEKEITNDLAFLIGKGFATLTDGKVIVGHDDRTSSNALNTNLVKGLLASGIEVTDIGLVTTPMLYYAREFFNIPYAIMITASHCPKEDNGFKLCDKQRSMYGDNIKDLLKIILSNNFINGTGHVTPYDLTLDYKRLIINKINLGPRKLNVVVDCGNGTTCYYNPDILRDLGVNVIPLFCDSDPDFPNHIPDPAVDDNMISLEEKVREVKADLGIAFDGDGDRIGIVDENGRLVKTDMFMLIIWKSIYKTCKNKTASFDVKCSLALKESLEKLGLKTAYNRTGHSYLKKAIKENHYDFAGEFSGHVCFADEFYGYDDALYAAGRLLRIISNTDLNISDYFKDVPKYFSSPENYIQVGDDKKYEIVEKVKAYAQKMNYNMITIDGVRIEYNDGFALVRVSNTSPAISVRFEGKTKEALDNHEKEIMNVINK